MITHMSAVPAKGKTYLVNRSSISEALTGVYTKNSKQFVDMKGHKGFVDTLTLNNVFDEVHETVHSDRRYLALLEHCGYAKPKRVVRFCDDVIAICDDVDTAAQIVENHIEERRIVLEGGESVACRLSTYEGIEEATVTYNKNLGSNETGIVTSKSRKYAISVRNSVIVSRLNGDRLDSVPTFDAC